MATESEGTRLTNLEHQLGDLREAVGRIEGKLHGEYGLLNTVKELEREIKILNKFRWLVLGGAGMLVFVNDLIKGILFRK